jgi:adenylate cyclase
LTWYSRLAGTDEERTLARLVELRSDLLDRSIALHHGRFGRRRLGRSGF